MINDLATAIWESPQFQQDFAKFSDYVLTAQVLPSERKQGLDEDEATKLLESASVLARTSELAYREAAYRIATGLYQVFGNSLGCDEILYFVLGSLGNFPAVRFVNPTLEPPKALPLPSLLEILGRQLDNTTRINGKTLVLTDFQRRVWRRLTNKESLAISGPTSVGKSFILQTFLHQFFTQNATSTVGYIVPTRALIYQVSSAIKSTLGDEGSPRAEIITVPMGEDEHIPQGSILVMTQERLQVMLLNHADLKLDLAIVDEAQSIGEETRGVILRGVLDELMIRNSQCQLFFAAPNAANPEIFGAMFPDKSVHAEKTLEAAVAQNLIFVDSDAVHRKQLRISVFADGQKRALGQLESSTEFGEKQDLLIQVTATLGNQAQNLVYALGPDECEKLAFGIMDLVRADAPVSHEREALASFVKEAIHPRFMLAETVRQGVGFHYGSMPTLLRQTIEDHFTSGSLRYLVSTSTLLHGINLPAKNIFLNRPYRGKNTPIEAADFWNLIGRAGRLGKEFVGNVFLVDYDSWPSQPLSGDKNVEIHDRLGDQLRLKTDDLVAYIAGGAKAPRDPEKPDPLESTFVRLYTDMERGTLARTLSSVGLDSASPIVQKVEGALAALKQTITLPAEVLRESPTISVHRQQNLYEYFMKRISEGKAETLIPLHPLSDGAYQNYVAIFKRLHTYILHLPKANKQHTFYATIALQWMRGNPLPMIIESARKQLQKTRPNVSYATAIRETLSEIENALRFRYVRLASCYHAVLKHALIASGKPKLLESISPLPMFLEVGASSQTMISFMGMGMSRISSAALAALTPRKNMLREEALRWIREQNLEVLDISPIMKNEISRMAQ